MNIQSLSPKGRKDSEHVRLKNIGKNRIKKKLDVNVIDILHKTNDRIKRESSSNFFNRTMNMKFKNFMVIQSPHTTFTALKSPVSQKTS